MKYLELTLARPEENLACDEALLHYCETYDEPGAMRLWESPEYFVVLGYSNKLNTEVHVEKCKIRGIPILRRFSGGGTVVQGPGCLNYTLVLPNQQLGSTLDVSASFRIVLERHRRVLTDLLAKHVEIAGISDIAMEGAKFSGNAQHRSRKFTLFHGTFLLDFDLALVPELLPMPSRQPAYRRARSHQDFIRNVPVSAVELAAALKREWQVRAPISRFDRNAITGYVQQRYGQDEWNLKF